MCVCYRIPSQHTRVSHSLSEARQSGGREQVRTYGVPHDDVHIGAEGIIHVLSNVEIDEIAEVVIHVNAWY